MNHHTSSSRIDGSCTTTPLFSSTGSTGKRVFPYSIRNRFSTTLGGFLLIPLLLAWFTPALLAQGGLLIFPMRLVFDGGKAVKELTLVNHGSDTMRYVMSFTQMRMNEDGGFENISTPDSGQRFADRYLRLFPKRVVLAPQEAQAIKVELVRANDLEPGEYRSHLYFRIEEEYKPLGEESAPRDTGTLSVQIRVKGGMTIAAIIRVGANDAKVELSDLALEQDENGVPMLRMAFHRTGGMSVYGDVFADYLSPDGRVIRVGSAQGMAVYVPNTLRKSKLELQRLPDVDYTRGALRLTYCFSRADGGAPMASASLQLGSK
jgi:hypothetical protein